MNRGSASSAGGDDSVELPWKVEFVDGEAILTVSDVAAAEQLLAAWAPDVIPRLEVLKEEGDQRDTPLQTMEAPGNAHPRQAAEAPGSASWQEPTEARCAAQPLTEARPAVMQTSTRARQLRLTPAS
eukprot:TRINITY_DN31602_c0_g1_i1.p1 TRINITY_DN31602_c0_g1~~TRINITY_DN31602_c0_g1_i1.p1  ORF type:complete len:127 (+),score=26.39 TRINITY_DN31602_c0_g1_i1:91-471(+)